jgi:hypothetical protein
VTPHYTHVKFTGTGYRAYCGTHGCRFMGQNHQLFKHMGRGQAAALRHSQMLAEEDARRHRLDEERKQRLAQHQEQQRRQ